MSELTAVFTALIEHQRAGERSVLCTVLSTRGSVPRQSGSRMLMCQDGSSVGTVGGGLGEALSQEEAKALMREDRPVCRIKAFELGAGKPGSIGVCGGRFEVLFQPVEPGDTAFSRLAEGILAAVRENIRTWLVTDLGDPQRAVSRLCGEKDGGEEGLRGLLKGRPAASADGTLYAEPVVEGGTVCLFGGGHVARETARELSGVDFSVVVYESRAEFAAPERFPQAREVINAPYEELGRRLALTERDMALVMTRGDGDDICLRELLRTDVGHIGCIGSRGKLAFLREKLRGEGFSEEALERIHNPIGLPIGSDTPAEIAVSVAAELIALRAKRRTEG